MNTKVYFSETTPGVFEKNKKFYRKNKCVPPKEYSTVNKFCWNVRDEINILFEKGLMTKSVKKRKRSSKYFD